MNKSSKVLIAAALGLGVAVSALSATALNANARGVAVMDDVVADRIAAAFASVPVAEVAPALAAAAARSGKGDLFVGRDCAAQKWPQIASECLVDADGRAGHPMRTVTVGYQTGDAVTVLVRVPAPRVASR